MARVTAPPAPAVSVVIPTRNRPGLVGRAVGSALAQSFRDLEVVVVLDGADDATAAELDSIDDGRLRVTVLEAARGTAAARNAGVAEARGAWVAFLDDDDEWLPAKLARQMPIALASPFRLPIVSCRLLARRGDASFVWPRRTPRPGEHASEYVFCRSSPFWGEGDVFAITLLTRRTLLETVPFRTGLRRYIENDWLLRAITVEGTGVDFVDDTAPLAIWHMDDDRARLTGTPDWRESLAWIRQSRHLVTARAYAGFVLGDVGVVAGRRREWRALGPLLREAFARGRPRLFDLALFGAGWIVPPTTQHRLARRFALEHARLDGAE
jgi:glycosyltransferase involved in cell wall biosynthesis